jgi:TctA family transporter
MKGEWVTSLELSTAMPPTTWFIYSIFIGVPDNGPISVSAVVPNKPYLIGNPYPSAIDADAFLAANSKALWNIYFFEHIILLVVSVRNRFFMPIQRMITLLTIPQEELLLQVIEIKQ